MSLLASSDAFLDIFFGVLMGHSIGDFINDYIKPIAKFAAGGPTRFVTQAISSVTPMVGDFIFGERVEQALLSTAGGLTGIIAETISTIVYTSLSWSFEGAMLGSHALMLLLDTVINKKRELPDGFFPTFIKILRGEKVKGINDHFEKARKFLKFLGVGL